MSFLRQRVEVNHELTWGAESPVLDQMSRIDSIRCIGRIHELSKITVTEFIDPQELAIATRRAGENLAILSRCAFFE